MSTFMASHGFIKNTELLNYEYQGYLENGDLLTTDDAFPAAELKTNIGLMAWIVN